MTAASSRRPAPNPSRGVAQPRSVPEALKALEGVFKNDTSGRSITDRLREASELAFLISPSTTADMLPEGCAVATTMIWVNPDTEAFDVGGGKYSLLKVALDRIAAAAGVSWDPRQSGRTDARDNPYCCSWQSVGRVRDLDGSLRDIIASKELDLTEGSPTILAIRERAADATDRETKQKKPRDPTKEIRQARLFLVRVCESKAKNAAIRSLGLKSTYTKAELLAKPFVVAKLMWTGQSNDPELRHAFAMKTADAMLGASYGAYGVPESHMLGAPRAVPMLHAARYDQATPRTVEEPASAPAARAQRAAAPARQEEPTPSPSSDAVIPPVDANGNEQASGDDSDDDADFQSPLVRFGRAKGQPLCEIDDDQLTWYVGAVEGSVNDPGKARYREENEAHLAEVQEEISYRKKL